ncbi:MAG: DUF177 domain-containing protein [Bacteroidia bacterium]|nr:DUF177 domain-containing protein [Bacteroidia bacterium]
MGYDKSFLKEYSLDVARVKSGKSQLSYKIEGKFFEKFEKSQVKEGDVDITLDIEKNQSHLDVKFKMEGWVYLPCDRCGEDYRQEIKNDNRIIFSFSSREADEETEVVVIEREEDQLSLIQEFYDFIHLALPMRRVPEPEVHLCDPEVLKLLGLDSEGNPVEQEKTDDEVDPRWAALKQLKDKLE